MQQQVSKTRAGQDQTWLRNYYAVRFLVSAIWLTVRGVNSTPPAAAA